MLRSAAAGAAAAGAGGGNAFYANAMSQFTVCRQPWDEYIKLLSKQDSEAYSTPMNPKPMYRGRKRGKEGWLFGEQVQLHYRRYPDEHIFSNLARWRQGQVVNDIALQQFKNAQPLILDDPDEQGFMTPEPEVYMKLNFKNPAVFSRFLTRTGHFYPEDVLPLNPEAVRMLRRAKRHAYGLGLYPKYGNPFWFRSQKHRPKAFKGGTYDPLRVGVKETVEHFCYNWLQTYRIRSYFREIETARALSNRGRKSTEEEMHSGYESGKTMAQRTQKIPARAYNATEEGFSEKKPTVQGLMSTQGLRRNPHLYSKQTNRRMGYPNPIGTTKKL